MQSLRIPSDSRRDLWKKIPYEECLCCLLYTSDAADERSSVDLGGRRIIKKKKHRKYEQTHIMKQYKDVTDTRIYVIINHNIKKNM